MNRRNFLKAIALAGITAPLASLALQQTSFASIGSTGKSYPIVTSWKDGDTYKTGLMNIENGQVSILTSADIPSRAHDVIYEANGNWLIVDRIPGDWLARYSTKGVLQMVKIESNSIRFAGHMQKSPDNKILYTSEYEIATGQTIIGVRDAKTLQKLKEFRTGRTDPHGFVLDRNGDIWVANGGIPKHIDPELQNTSIYPVESAITHTNAKTGELIKEWRIKDNNLSMRHLAWGQMNGKTVLGASIKAAHPTLKEREKQPVLAILHDDKIEPIHFDEAYLGYAGDIAFANGQFYLSCTRANNIAVYDVQTKTVKKYNDVYESCALKLSKDNSVLYAGTRGLGIDNNGHTQVMAMTGKSSNVVLENHVDFCTDLNSFTI